MTYTKAIREIFSRSAVTDFKGYCSIADDAGYEALSYNGDIYIRVTFDLKPKWINTPFTIGDFEV